MCEGLKADGCTYLEPQSFISEFRLNFGKTSGHNARIITFYSVLCRMLIYKYMYNEMFVEHTITRIMGGLVKTVSASQFGI